MHKLGKSLCTHLDVSATPSEKMLLAAKTKKAQASALHEGGSSRHASASGMEKESTIYTMVSLPWLVMYLLLPACEKASKAICKPRIARASYDLLHVLAKLACETLADHSGVAGSITAPCGGIATVKKDASIQFDGA